MNFYLQFNNEGYVTDCITYPHEGYENFLLDVPLPSQFIAGWWKLVDGQFVEDKQRKAELNINPDQDLLDGIMQLRADMDYLSIMTGVDLDV